MKLHKSLRLANGTVIPRGTTLNFSTEGFANYKGNKVAKVALEATLPQLIFAGMLNKYFKLQSDFQKYKDKLITSIDKAKVWSFGFVEETSSYALFPFEIKGDEYKFERKAKPLTLINIEPVPSDKIIEFITDLKTSDSSTPIEVYTKE